MRITFAPATAVAAIALIALCGCSTKPAAKETKTPMNPKVSKQDYGKTADGQPVDLYTLTNANGMSATILTYGGIVQKLIAPDKAGKPADVVLGFDTLGEYVKDSPFFGAITGRVANRIGKARFALDGKEYTLAANNGPNCLHGGKVGFDKKVWAVKAANDKSLALTYTSPDGEEGFPGALACTVT